MKKGVGVKRCILVLTIVAIMGSLQATNLEQVDSLRTLADSLLQEGYFSQAASVYESEVALRAGLADTAGWCRALCKTSESYRRNEENDTAAVFAEKAIEIGKHAFGERDSLVATAYHNLANTLDNRGFYQEALDMNLKAVDIRLEVLDSNHIDIGDSYNNIGLIYWSFGNYSAALEHYTHALGIYKIASGPDDFNVGKSYNNIGNLYLQTGDYQTALDNHKQALRIFSAELGADHVYVAYSYNNLGIIYWKLGELDSALVNNQAALRIFSGVLGAEHPYVGGTCIELGKIHLDAGEYDDAVEQFGKALAIFLAGYGEVHPEVATAYNNLGIAYRMLEKYPEAIENYQKSLAIHEELFGENHPDVAASHNNIGNVFMMQGVYDVALQWHQNALRIRLSMLGSDHPDVAWSYANIGRGLYESGEKDSALLYYEKSIDIFETSRSSLASQSLQVAYSATVQDRYEDIIAILLEMGRVEEAFEYLERSKSKSLKDALEESEDVEIGKGEIKLKLAESRELSGQLDDVEYALLSERLKPDSLRDETLINDLSELLAQTKAEYFKIVAQIQSDPDYAFAVAVDPIQLGSLKEEIPPGQKIIMSYSAADKLFLFLISNEGYEVRAVPVSRDSVEGLVSECRRMCFDEVRNLYKDGKLLGWSWADDGSEFYETEVKQLKSVLAQLFNYLVRPFHEQLAGAEVVTFIPSGKLYYVPWGALYKLEDARFLSEEYNWNILTSAELMRCVQRRDVKSKRRKKQAVLVGNPLGANLPFAEEEVTAIKTAYPRSRAFTGASASEHQLSSAVPEGQTLHLATHCVLNANSPWDSYIHLARTDTTDGHWTAAEISGESWQDMELVTLSACETALGGSRPGMEFESMAKAFSLAMVNAPSIVATLWSVADVSTKEFMVSFYDELRSNPKSEALRAAQQELIHSDKYSHPFFWAPFILIGEWR